jgi:hypothetical protein
MHRVPIHKGAVLPAYYAHIVVRHVGIGLSQCVLVRVVRCHGPSAGYGPPAYRSPGRPDEIAGLRREGDDLRNAIAGEIPSGQIAIKPPIIARREDSAWPLRRPLEGAVFAHGPAAGGASAAPASLLEIHLGRRLVNVIPAIFIGEHPVIPQNRIRAPASISG